MQICFKSLVLAVIFFSCMLHGRPFFRIDCLYFYDLLVEKKIFRYRNVNVSIFNYWCDLKHRVAMYRMNWALKSVYNIPKSRLNIKYIDISVHFHKKKTECKAFELQFIFICIFIAKPRAGGKKQLVISLSIVYIL